MNTGVAPHRRIVEVAVGVLLRPDGSFLLASRPLGKPYAGYWEFPGGKLEPGETVAQALARELHEELGITIGDALPWVTIEHVYTHAHVRLHFTRVTRWSGELQAREAQEFAWFDLAAHKPEPLLPATIPCLRWLGLPTAMGVSCAGMLGVEKFLAAFDRALGQGLRLIQMREPALDPAALERLLGEVGARARDSGARVVINSMHPRKYWDASHGVHLRAVDLAQLRDRPDLDLVGASVHARAELDMAGDLGLDYAVLGAVLPTLTHAGQATLGWDGFARIVQAPPLPVYAIGGMQASNLVDALAHGAHGIAMMRAAWS